MKITAYNQHDVGSFSSLGRLPSLQQGLGTNPFAQSKDLLSAHTLKMIPSVPPMISEEQNAANQ